jgi:hypothetical protein
VCVCAFIAFDSFTPEKKPRISNIKYHINNVMPDRYVMLTVSDLPNRASCYSYFRPRTYIQNQNYALSVEEFFKLCMSIISRLWQLNTRLNFARAEWATPKKRDLCLMSLFRVSWTTTGDLALILHVPHNGQTFQHKSFWIKSLGLSSLTESEPILHVHMIHVCVIDGCEMIVGR